MANISQEQLVIDVETGYAVDAGSGRFLDHETGNRIYTNAASSQNDSIPCLQKLAGNSIQWGKPLFLICTENASNDKIRRTLDVLKEYQNEHSGHYSRPFVFVLARRRSVEDVRALNVRGGYYVEVENGGDFEPFRKVIESIGQSMPAEGNKERPRPTKSLLVSASSSGSVRIDSAEGEA